MFSVSTKLRPTRIGFLVKPSDRPSLRRIMEANACLWGGTYNPIIPVFRNTPPEWSHKISSRRSGTRGYNIARGYVRFFEPDVYVEAEEGLADQLGIRGIDGGGGRDTLLCHLDEFLAADDRGQHVPKFGLSMLDVMRSIYETERRFQLRDDAGAMLVESTSGSFETEVLFGRYPSEPGLEYFEKGYHDVFRPAEIKSGPDVWRWRLLEGKTTPLAVTHHQLSIEHLGGGDSSVFIFDPSNPLDVIDAWNARLEGGYSYMLPIGWVEPLLDELAELVAQYYRPIPNNPSGLMFEMTLEFSRTLSEETVKAVATAVRAKVPDCEFLVQHWRPPFWEPSAGLHGPRFVRRQVSAHESRHQLVNSDTDNEVRIDTKSPDFASRYSLTSARWATTVSVSAYGEKSVCTRYPFNTFDRAWPRLSLGRAQIGIGGEGFTLLGQYEDSSDLLRLETAADAVSSWLKYHGVGSTVSDAGRVTEQILNALPHHALHMFAHKELLHLLNGMANRTRIQANDQEVAEHEFQGRHRPYTMMARKIQGLSDSSLWKRLSLQRLVDANVLRLGTVTTCPHCQFENWHGIDEAAYTLRCERCLSSYDFPQGDLGQGRGSWAYRVIGPFATPDYARGAYSVLLIYRLLKELGDRPGNFDALTFTPPLEMTFPDGFVGETDFTAWMPGTAEFPLTGDVSFVIGEAKSFGRNSIKKGDLAKLKAMAERLPKCGIVIAVLKSAFDEEEKVQIKKLVEWGRVPDDTGNPRCPVLLLTGIELFADHTIKDAWEAVGPPHSNHADYFFRDTFRRFAEATQSIHLDLPPYYEWLRARRR